MSSQVALLSQIFTITGPVFLMVIVGIFLKKVKLIDDAFITVASRLTFKATLPTLLFLNILKADLSTAFQLDLVVYFYFASASTFCLSWLLALKSVPKAERGIFVQGAFRGNCGIIGLALANSMLGAYGLSAGGVLSGFIIILFNVLSIVVLAIYSDQLKTDFKAITLNMMKNPLIISVVAGLLASWSGLTLPKWIEVSGHYFASLTLPMALICVGGSLSMASFITSGKVAISASLIKVIWSPLLFTAIAGFMGFDGKEMGLLFIFLSSPTAAASYVMARAAGSDGKLAANIIAVTTAISVFTTTAGLYILGALGLVALS